MESSRDGLASVTCQILQLAARIVRGSSVGIAYHVRQSGLGAEAPWTFTVAPDHNADHTWNLAGTGSGSAYDLSVYGPSGWYRLYQDSVAAHAADLFVEADEDSCDDALRLPLTIGMASSCAWPATQSSAAWPAFSDRFA